jgi:exodeoxyribonuclease V alpha subunit
MQNMMVLTGGPGTGKTQTIRQICALCDAMRIPVGLCAPTGKAARRMQDLTGRPAQTIHRMLKAGWGFFKHNSSNPVKQYKLVIVDESSMLDIELAFHLLDALPIETKILFVGDVDQLPPVGPGSFFRDLIKSGFAKVVKLQTNHRQGIGSSIADQALLINQGALKLSFDDDIMYIDCQSPIAIREKIALCLKNLKESGYDLVRDVQILTPQKGTTVGTYSLNELLRFSINKKAKAKEKFSVGDKVMQIVNDYTLEVFNGFLGVIKSVHPNHYMIEFFDDDKQETKYPLASAENLMHAYACTIHKFQGSEARAGISIMSSSHIYMLSRNLLYTAITRFKEKCIILGDGPALRKAIVNTREQERYSDLPNLLDKARLDLR